jgi:dTDP-3-amino-3,4,6-trideoxy-alpha-D-glucose transaminase
MRALVRLAERHGLALVEDAAQAHGATFEGLQPGGFGVGAAFSFYPSKNLGALGDGGAVCTQHPEIADRVRQLRDLGQRRKGEHVLPGVNERLDGLQAAFLRVKLPRLAAANDTRRRHAALYREWLAGAVGLLEERAGTPCVYHLFPIRVRERADVVARLAARGIATGLHYTPALRRQPALEGLIRVAGDTARADAWATEELSLPMSPALREDEIERAAREVIACIR